MVPLAGDEQKKKVYGGIWEALARPKDCGGLGFMDVKVMNICLLCKWLERLERCDSSIYVQLLRRKYLGEQSIFQQKKKLRGSQFWRDLLSIRHWFQQGRVIAKMG